MISKKFSYLSDLLAEQRKSEYAVRLEVEVCIESASEDDAYAGEITIYDKSTDTCIDINTLPPQDITAIEARVDKIASESSHEAYSNWRADREAAAYDRSPEANAYIGDDCPMPWPRPKRGE